MNQFESIWLEFWRSVTREGDYPMVTFHARDPRKDDNGLRSLWFVFSFEEWKDALRGGMKAFSDGYHKLDVMFDTWTFFDFEPPAKPAGIADIRYRRLDVPLRVREILMFASMVCMRQYDYQEPTKWGNQEKVFLDLSPHVDNWSHEYGQGKGMIALNASQETRKRFMERIYDDNFASAFDRVKRIALNSTHSRNEYGEVHLSLDGNGFFWRAGGMVGGLINHGTDECPDWSVHT